MYTGATAYASQANVLDCEARRAWGNEGHRGESQTRTHLSTSLLQYGFKEQLYLKTDALHRYSTSVFTYFLKQRGWKSQQALLKAGNWCFGSLEKSWCSAHPPKLAATAEWGQGHTSPPQFTLHCFPQASPPTTSCIPWAFTAAPALLVGAVLLSRAQHPPGHPGRPLSHRPYGFHSSAHTCPCPLLADFPASNPSKSPFSRLLPGSQHLF